jgi:hypothetical protein
MYQLRVWHRSGLTVWDVKSVEHGWNLWANFLKADGYYRNNTTTARVVLASSPL